MTKAFWKLMCVIALTNTVFMIALAFADVPAVGLPGTDAQAFDFASVFWKFMVTKQYAAAVGPGLTLLVWGLKKYDLPFFTALKVPQVGAAIDTFLNKPFVSFLLPTVVAAVGGFVTSLATGHSFVDALGAVWACSTTAITTYVGLKKVGEQLAAGNAAAAVTTTKTEAVAAMEKAAADEAAKTPPAAPPAP